jgi:molybdopterin/thiamine biosynthesis adenylyltransferase
LPTPWWDRYPGRYQQEIDALNASGIPYAIDAEAKRKGFLRIDASPIVEGRTIHVVADYPELFPWFRFEVRAPEESLSHHQHPFGKNLCVFPRDTYYWRPGSDTLAGVLLEQLPAVLSSGAAVEGDAAVEELQGEPFSDYYDYLASSIVLVDGSWRLADGTDCGTALVGVDRTDVTAGPDRVPVLRAAALEIRSDQGILLYDAGTTVKERFQTHRTARWSRLARPPATNNFTAVFQVLAEADARAPILGKNKVGGGQLSIRIGLFAEEQSWRAVGDRMGQGWLVACRFESQASNQRGRTHRKKGTEAFCYLARLGRFFPEDVLQRAPELLPIRNKVVTQIGLGCIGAPSALEFARSGIGEFRAVDHDHIDPATLVRWPRGLSAAGFRKDEVIREIIRSDYPFTNCVVRHWRFGSVNEGERDDWTLLDELLEDSHILFDASADVGVQYFLADVARSKGIPFVSAFGTAGGWGGALVRIIPGRTEGCWSCYLNSVGTVLPSPSTAPLANGFVQPAGCADPTFVAAGFDMAEVSTAAVRLVVSTLCEGTPDGYPSFDWDVAILNLRDPHGRPIPPSWSTHRLLRHPNCAECNERA